jgi:hypothetical protein
VLAKERMAAIQFRHGVKKPKNCRTWSKKGQDTESKARVISIFRRRQATLLACSTLADD